MLPTVASSTVREPNYGVGIQWTVCYKVHQRGLKSLERVNLLGNGISFSRKTCQLVRGVRNRSQTSSSSMSNRKKPTR